MDAIQLLKADHKKVRELLDDLAGTTARGAKTRATLLGKITTELEVHTKIEDEIFYPAFKEAGEKNGDSQMVFEAYEEHRAVGDLVLPDLNKTPPGSEQFSGRAKVLKELVEHHIEEEEGDMFPRAKALMSKEQLKTLGDKLAMRKQELLK